MKKKGIHPLLTVVVFALVSPIWTACNHPIETCECSHADLYGFPLDPGIHMPISTYEEELRETKPLTLTNSIQIDSLREELMNMKRSDFEASSFDTHVVLDFHCNNGKTLTVLSNNILVRYNGENYEPSDTYISYLEQVIRTDTD